MSRAAEGQAEPRRAAALGKVGQERAEALQPQGTGPPAMAQTPERTPALAQQPPAERQAKPSEAAAAPGVQVGQAA